MAGRPLRPATDHRHGGPLPRRLPNRPQDPPKAPHGFPQPASADRAHAGLPAVSDGYPPPRGRFPTCYAPVRHVTPRRKPVRLACIRHAASVDPEPGSNSPPFSPAETGNSPKAGISCDYWCTSTSTRRVLTQRHPGNCSVFGAHRSASSRPVSQPQRAHLSTCNPRHRSRERPAHSPLNRVSAVSPLAPDVSGGLLSTRPTKHNRGRRTRQPLL